MSEVTECRRVFEGEMIQVEVLTLAEKEGESRRREVVRHRPGVAIVVLREESDVVGYGLQLILVRHSRPAVGEELVELVAGMVDEGEEPLEAARRELREEAGLEAAHWQSLGSVYSSPGFTDEVIHLFLAREVRHVEQKQEESEGLALTMMPLALALESVREGKLRDLKTVAGLLWAAAQLQSEQAA